MKEIYIEETSDNKHRATILALQEHPEYTLRKVIFPKTLEKNTITKTETIEASRSRARKIAVEHPKPIPLDALCLGIHKGIHVHRVTYQTFLLLAVTAITNVSDTVKRIETVVLQEPIIVDGIGKMIIDGTDPNDAYYALTGVDISNKKIPLLEILFPEKKEVIWIQEGILLAIQKLNKKVIHF